MIAATRPNKPLSPRDFSQFTPNDCGGGVELPAGDSPCFSVSISPKAGTCHVRTLLGGGGNPEIRYPERDEGCCELWEWVVTAGNSLLDVLPPVKLRRRWPHKPVSLTNV